MLGDAAEALPTWRLFLAFVQGKAASEVVSIARSLGGGAVTPTAQQAFLDTCLRHPLVQAHPVSDKQCGRVLKLLFAAAEADGQEVLDHLAEEVCLRAAAGEVGGWGHKTFAYLPHGTMEDVASQSSAELINAVVAYGGAPASPRGDGSCGLITLHLSDNLFEGSTGCHEWEAGFLLAEIVLNNPEIVRGRRCLEIGCGAGVVGICLARAGAGSIVCTDGDMRTVENCRRNMATNGVPVAADSEGRHRCEQLLWECGWGGEAPEVVLGADLLYDPGVIPALVALLHGLLRAGAQAYIATTLRNATTVEAFVEAACGAGLAVEDATQELQRRRDIGFQACDVLENRAAVRVHRLWLRE